MCGIFGLFGDVSHQFDIQHLAAMAHRGPDDKGTFVSSDDGLVFGHTRLSIIDLSSQGHQPMTDGAGRYVIVFNGEIYNYRELQSDLQDRGYKFKSSSDTEVVLNAFIEYGEKCFAMLRGMFALAIYDTNSRELVLARDRLGIKPLLYSRTLDGFVFSSEIKVLLAGDYIEKRIDPLALNELLHFGAVRQPRTILSSLYQLQPGHYMRINRDGEYKEHPYVSSYQEIAEPVPLDYEEAVRELRKKLEEATLYHLVADVEVGCFLSGGIDSTAVLALMGRHVSRPIKAFTVGFEGPTGAIDETAIAERSARELNAEFHKVTIAPRDVEECFDDFIQSLDQPSVDGLNSYLVSRETGQHVKVALSGLGGDEIFAGYPHFKWIPEYGRLNKGLLDKPLEALYRLKPNRFTRKSFYKGLSPSEAVHRVRTFSGDLERRSMLNRFVPVPVLEKGAFAGTATAQVSVDEIEGYLKNTLLRDVDCISMWHSLEVRPVLLDHPLVDFALRLPDEFKMRDKAMKSIFVDAVKDLIPSEVYSRKKTGFEMPFKYWMNGCLKERVASIWESDTAAMLFTKEWLRNSANKTNSGNLVRKDWIATVLTAWCKAYGINNIAEVH